MGGTQHFVRATGLPRAGEEHSALLVRTCHVLGGISADQETGESDGQSFFRKQVQTGLQQEEKKTIKPSHKKKVKETSREPKMKVKSKEKKENQKRDGEKKNSNLKKRKRLESEHIEENVMRTRYKTRSK